MHTIRKIMTAAVLSSLCSIHAAQAQQTGNNTATQMALQAKWFKSMDDNMQHQFTIELGEGESLIVRFKKVDHWTPVADFNNIFNRGHKVMAAYRDSLLDEQPALSLDINIPATGNHMITRFKRYSESGNLISINDDDVAVLKFGIDTLRILQEKRIAGSKGETNVADVQYTFLLKRLSNYSAYAQDMQWQSKAAATIDSVVALHRRKLKRPDAPTNKLRVAYDPARNKLVQTAGVNRESRSFVEAGLGISLVRNTLCPNVEYGIGVYIHKTTEFSLFAKLSTNTFVRFVETAPDKYKGYGTAFVNLEFGGESGNYSPKSLFYKTSLGFGYKLINKKSEDRDPSMDKQMYRLFLNYSINKFFVITPELVSNFRNNDRNNSWLGISFNFRLL